MTREEAIETLKRAVEVLKSASLHESEFAEAIDMAIEALERKCGEWIVISDDIGDFRKAGYRWIKCNKCTNQVKIRLDSPLYDFCPNCGSDMKGEKHE